MGVPFTAAHIAEHLSLSLFDATPSSAIPVGPNIPMTGLLLCPLN